MRIGIDIRSLAEPAPTGVSRAKRALLRALIETFRDDTFVLYANAFRPPQTSFHQWLQVQPNVHIIAHGIPNKVVNACISLFRRPRLDKLCGGVDGVLVLDVQFCALSPGVKRVVVAHDLTFIRYTHLMTPVRRLWHALVRAAQQLREADTIIAVSESTRRDCEDVFAGMRKPIVVIPHGSDAFHSHQSMQKPERPLPDRYILCIGTNEPRKNIRTIIAALIKGHLDRDGVRLVLAGQDGWGNAWTSDLTERERQSVIALGYVSDNELAWLVAHASVLAYPSITEGYGFPIRDAINAGISVLTSHTSAMPEVAGNASFLIDPMNVRDCADGLSRLLRESVQRNAISMSQAVSWDDTARRVMNVLRDTLHA